VTRRAGGGTVDGQARHGAHQANGTQGARRRRRAAVAAALLLAIAPGLEALGGAGVRAAAGPPCNSGTETDSGVTVTCTYSYTGSAQQFTVLPGVDTVTVEAIGTHGGAGDVVTATLTGLGGVPTLYVYVGGNGGTTGINGGNGGTTGINGGYDGAGGFNGGGAGSYAEAGGGGGASDVRTASGDLTTRLVVASGAGSSVKAGGGAAVSGNATVHSGGPGGGYYGSARPARRRSGLCGWRRSARSSPCYPRSTDDLHWGGALDY